MSAPAPVSRRANLLLVTLLLAISVLVEQFFIVPILPWLNQFGSFRPMIVFLDIPAPLPAIDIIPVSIIFALFYQIAPSAGIGREHPAISSGGRVWKALSGWWLVIALTIGGGFVFQYTQEFLPKNISNGIDSFGVRADLTLPYPSGGLIHLHGSVVMLFFSFIGVLILRRRIAIPIAEPVPLATTTTIISTHTPAIAAPTLSSSRVSASGTLIGSPSVNEVLAAQQNQQNQQNHQLQQNNQHARYQPPVNTTATITTAPPPTPTEKRYQPVTITPGAGKPAPPPTSKSTSAPTSSYVQRPATIITPEPPPTCRLTTPPPIAVVMPRPTPATGKMHPCYIIGGLKPSKP